MELPNRALGGGQSTEGSVEVSRDSHQERDSAVQKDFRPRRKGRPLSALPSLRNCM
jgi:hypothetical protein